MAVKKFVFVAVIFSLFSAFIFAETVRIKVNGAVENFDVPSDIAKLVNQNKEGIEKALEKQGISKSELQNAIDEINSVYNHKGTSYAPLSSTIKGLDGFSEDLSYSLANAQLMQNVWAEAWIGKFLPGFHLGCGINVGAGQLQLDSIKKATKALDIGGLDFFPSFLVFPTVAADVRIGGIILPFDIGASYLTIDSSKFSKLNIEPLALDFYTLQIDARWALVQGKAGKPKISVGAGWALTKGGIGINNDYAGANISFKSTCIYGQAQISKKLKLFIPFIGVKLSYVRSDVDWSTNAQWDNIFSGDSSELSKLQDWGVLPTKFEGGFESNSFIPQVFSGFCIDLFIINLTFSAGWDFKNKLFSGAFNFRIAW